MCFQQHLEEALRRARRSAGSMLSLPPPTRAIASPPRSELRPLSCIAFWPRRIAASFRSGAVYACTPLSFNKFEPDPVCRITASRHDDRIPSKPAAPFPVRMSRRTSRTYDALSCAQFHNGTTSGAAQLRQGNFMLPCESMVGHEGVLWSIEPPHY